MRWVPYAVPPAGCGDGGDPGLDGGVGREALVVRLLGGVVVVEVGGGATVAGGDELVEVVLPPRADRPDVGGGEVMGEGEGGDPARLGEAGLQVPGAEVVDRRHSQVVGRLAATISSCRRRAGPPRTPVCGSPRPGPARHATGEPAGRRSDSVMLAHTSRIEAGNVRVRTVPAVGAVLNSRPVGVGVMRCPPRGVVGQRLLGPAAITAGCGGPRCPARRAGAPQPDAAGCAA